MNEFVYDRVSLRVFSSQQNFPQNRTEQILICELFSKVHTHIDTSENEPTRKAGGIEIYVHCDNSNQI